jgi:hypothetical protein
MIPPQHSSGNPSRNGRPGPPAQLKPGRGQPGTYAEQLHKALGSQPPDWLDVGRVAPAPPLSPKVVERLLATIDHHRDQLATALMAILQDKIISLLAEELPAAVRHITNHERNRQDGQP